ncbi:glutamate--tRNA ligase [Candidatus Microgenomates bacterium]|nr:glutamate--tRNA ligase [Candidatus Microgenomates bacterium]
MVRTRIAPSPTGENLHIGSVYTALINYVFARQHHGRFIIRIEDTDQKRLVKDSEKRILASLKWFGIKADESSGIGGPYGPYRQSERLDLYKHYAEKLVAQGDAYYCSCSPERLKKLRQEQQKKKLPPKYDGRCRELEIKKLPARNASCSDAGRRNNDVIRLKVPKTGETSFNDLIRGKITFQNKLIDDQVLLKSDGFPTYHLAVVVDDHVMKITHIIRGEEWISSAPKHILLYQAFGWSLPIYAHHPLLRNPDKSKLSKRRNPVWASWYKEQGFLPEAILNYLSLMGWSHPQEKEIFSVDEFLKTFSLERISTTGPVFDLKKLEWMNGEYIRQIKNEKLKIKIYEFYKKKYPEDLIEKIVPLVKTRIKKLSEFEDLAEFFFTEPKIDPKLLYKKLNKKEANKAIKSYMLHVIRYKKDDFKSDKLEKTARDLADKLGIKIGLFFTLLRVVITGKIVSPPLCESMEILGKDEVIKRLEKAVKV